MKKNVHNNSIQPGVQISVGFGNNKRRFFLTFLVALVTYAGVAQTFSTRASGNWNNPLTWEGGVIPTNSIGTAVTVNIRHGVSYNLGSDLHISGKLNIANDTLRFPSSFDQKVVIHATGQLYIKNGGFVQTIAANRNDMDVNGGRVVLENSYLGVSKAFKAKDGAKRTYKNSVVRVGERYELDGTSTNRGIDSVVNSYLETGMNNNDLEIKSHTSFFVANATVIVAKGKFLNRGSAEIKVLPNAASNFGFDLLKTDDNLENDGVWDAKIDALCVGKEIKGSASADIDMTRAQDCNEIMQIGDLPEISFGNPILKSGVANKEGAVYRFASVTAGVDAEIRLKKFSRSDIVMRSVDNNTLGWGKAFQPEFGLSGLVAPNQHWFVDFELTFYKAGTDIRQKMSKMVFTALDVDGDGLSIREYATFANPTRAEYSPVSLLANGEVDILDPIADAGDLNTILGTVQNFVNIDTAATQVMATFTYLNKDQIVFRYGARSGAVASNGAGIRLNSLWSKPFSLDPWMVLPVQFSSFNVTYDKGDANLTWSAPVSEKLSGFIVQRSTDGNNFTDVATVFAGTRTSYTYSDKGVASASGVIYYRVVSVDYTKEANYSTIRMIRLAKNDAATLSLLTYPNPVVNDVRITLPNAWQGKPVMLQLYTSTGVIAKTIQLGSASQTETMQLDGLSRGMYVVKAVCGEEAAQQRIVKN